VDSVWADWFNPKAHDYWTEEVTHFHDLIPFDGVWVDLNEMQSFCTFSCGNVELVNITSPLPGGISNVSVPDPRQLNFPPYKINK
jgi:alpha-glucosidase (family GH31 glycosyl hydrolase)